MYKNFDFNQTDLVHEEIIKIASTSDENEAIVKAFHFQRYYAKAIKSRSFCTGYQALETAMKNIRSWIGNEEGFVKNRIDFLWANIPN